jgi:hypothetical protein
VRQRAFVTLGFGLLSVLALFALGSNIRRDVYLVVFTLLVGLGACWLGVTAMRGARRSGSLRPASSIAGVVFGVIGSAVSALLLIFLVTFWHPLISYSQCQASASTVSAQQACSNQLQRSMGVSGLGPGG